MRRIMRERGYGTVPMGRFVGEPKVDYIGVFDAPSTNTAVRAAGDFSGINPQAGPPRPDESSGVGVLWVDDMPWIEVVLLSVALSSGKGVRCKVVGWSPVPQPDRAWATDAERRVLYEDGIDDDPETPFLWVPTPLLDLSGVGGSLKCIANGAYGVSASVLFCSDLTIEGDHTIGQNAVVAGGGVGHVARAFCTVDGYPVLSFHATGYYDGSNNSTGVQVLVKAGGS